MDLYGSSVPGPSASAACSMALGQLCPYRPYRPSIFCAGPFKNLELCPHPPPIGRAIALSSLLPKAAVFRISNQNQIPAAQIEEATPSCGGIIAFRRKGKAIAAIAEQISDPASLIQHRFGYNPP